MISNLMTIFLHYFSANISLTLPQTCFQPLLFRSLLKKWVIKEKKKKKKIVDWAKKKNGQFFFFFSLGVGGGGVGFEVETHHAVIPLL